MYDNYLDVNPEVAKALDEGQPVVALESTIIAHGMPYPKNVETALAVEDVIRGNGAVPATIGILNGRIKIGMTKEEIEYMAHAENVMKVSRRDFPLVIIKEDGRCDHGGRNHDCRPYGRHQTVCDRRHRRCTQRSRRELRHFS